MNPTNAKRAVIAGTVLAVLLGGELTAQVVAADRLLLPPTTNLGDGVVFMGPAQFLHAWDWNGADSIRTNTFLGIDAGNFWTPASPGGDWEGRLNTGIGASALSVVETGSHNTGVGALALQNTSSGSHNTAVGAQALTLNETGVANTAVGSGALAHGDSGDFNNAFGSGALNSNSGSYNSAFGGLNHNTTGSYNTAVGHNSLQSNSTGWGNTAVGVNALLTNHAGSWNTVLGYQADIEKDEYQNATAIGANAIATGSNMVRIGDAAVTVIEGQVPFSWVSDRRSKRDIATLELGLELVRKLRPVSYRLKNGNDRLDLGFVAQEVEAVLGDGYNAVSAGGDGEHLLSMRYTDLIAPLVRAVQELDQRRAAAEAELALLRGDNAELRAAIDDLRSDLITAATRDRARIDRLEGALLAVAAGLETGGARQIASTQP